MTQPPPPIFVLEVNSVNVMANDPWRNSDDPDFMVASNLSVTEHIALV